MQLFSDDASGRRPKLSDGVLFDTGSPVSREVGYAFVNAFCFEEELGCLIFRQNPLDLKSQGVFAADAIASSVMTKRQGRLIVVGTRVQF